MCFISGNINEVEDMLGITDIEPEIDCINVESITLDAFLVQLKKSDSVHTGI